LLGSPCVGGYYADEISIVDEFDAGDFLCGRAVDGVERSVESGGAEDLAKHHSGESDIGWVLMLSGYKLSAVGLGDSGAGDLPVLCGDKRHGGGDSGDELFPLR